MTYECSVSTPFPNLRRHWHTPKNWVRVPSLEEVVDGDNTGEWLGLELGLCSNLSVCAKSYRGVEASRGKALVMLKESTFKGHRPYFQLHCIGKDCSGVRRIQQQHGHQCKRQGHWVQGRLLPSCLRVGSLTIRGSLGLLQLFCWPPARELWQLWLENDRSGINRKAGVGFSCSSSSTNHVSVSPCSFTSRTTGSLFRAWLKGRHPPRVDHVHVTRPGCIFASSDSRHMAVTWG